MQRPQMKLPQLQNLIKRDPEAYKDEFLMQFRHFNSEYEIFKLRPARDYSRFSELITFICHVSGCYKQVGGLSAENKAIMR